jgi:transposase
MSAQQALPLPSPPPSNNVVINPRCSLRMEADQRVIVVAGLPVHHYRAEDAAAEAYAMVFLVDSGFAQQTDVARAFGCSVRTVRRNQARYAQGGMAALGHEGGWRRGRRRISPKRLRRIEQMKSQGMSNRAIAHKLGVTEKAIRRLVGPTRGAASGQLRLPKIPPPKKKSAATAPRAASADVDDDEDDGDDQEEERGPSAAPSPATASDDEPVPKSLDRDASNRTLDRQLAYLGLLKDAAPLFRDGSSIPGSGVL